MTQDTPKFGGLLWKCSNRLSRDGCWLRGYHLRRDGKYRRWWLQCGLLDDYARLPVRHLD